jgi:predicted transposase YbfD/YdcC
MARLSIHRHFVKLKDPRRRRRCRHRLIDIIVIAICAVVANCDDWQEIEIFARGRLDWFRRFLALPNGVPSHDTFERVFDRIDPRAFHDCFQEWIAAITASLDVQQIAIDGKTLCGSASSKLGPLHLVNAWATAHHLSLAQVAVEEGSNEIPAIPKLLELLELNGALVSIDAIGCQKAIAEKIVDRGGDYVLVVKDNQPKLLEAIQAQMGEVFDGVADDSSERETRDCGHGREELRIYTTRLAPAALRAEWPGLKVIGMCYHERTIQGKTSVEGRYFIGSKAAGARYYSKTLRHHWRIENCCHWQMDVTFGEDASRISKRHAAENFALLRRLALSVLKQHPDKKSIKCKRLAACLDPKFLEEVLQASVKAEKL